MRTDLDPDEYRTVQSHAGISFYGQKSNCSSRRLAKMNLAMRRIDNNLGRVRADRFHRDLHPDFKADFILGGTTRFAFQCRRSRSLQLSDRLHCGRWRNQLQYADRANTVRKHVDSKPKR